MRAMLLTAAVLAALAATAAAKDITGTPDDDFLDGGAGNDTGDGGPGFDMCVNVETRISCEA